MGVPHCLDDLTSLHTTSSGQVGIFLSYLAICISNILTLSSLLTAKYPDASTGEEINRLVSKFQCHESLIP